MSPTFGDVLKVAEIIALETGCRYVRDICPRNPTLRDRAAAAQRCIALKAVSTQELCICRDAAGAVMRHLNTRPRD